MTEIEIHQPANLPAPTLAVPSGLDPDSMRAKVMYAEELAKAGILPKSYRGQPGNVLFAIELGYSLGLDPAQALTKIHVIEGTPSASANLISGLVRRAGHRLRVRVERENGLAAIAEIVRADDPDFTFVARWDMDRARVAGLAGKDVWKKYPEAMLKARAITEVAREACEEALSGLNYTPEELGHEVDRFGAPAAPPAVGVRPTLVEQIQETAPATEPAAPGLEGIRPEQKSQLAGLLREGGYDSAEKVAALYKETLGRPVVGGTRALSVDDAARIIDHLVASEPQDAEPMSTVEQRAEIERAAGEAGVPGPAVLELVSEAGIHVGRLEDLTVTEADAVLAKLRSLAADSAA